ncbi:LOW QUALITY PROTEIN: hypothetical protein HJC23_011907 [Cyclotella cryptica]|uniref:Uncharacterized protein n=1 Tax=Cyclotella cryptica TaxID=29204 RepID=A0ABD3PJ91_9STRA
MFMAGFLDRAWESVCSGRSKMDGYKLVDSPYRQTAGKPWESMSTTMMMHRRCTLIRRKNKFVLLTSLSALMCSRLLAIDSIDGAQLCSRKTMHGTERLHRMNKHSRTQNMKAKHRQSRTYLRHVVFLLRTVSFSQSFIHVPPSTGIQFRQTKLGTLLFSPDFNNFEEFEAEPSGPYNGHESKAIQNIVMPNGRNQPQSLFPTLHNILTSPPISYSDVLSVDILSKLTNSGFVDDNDVSNFGKGFLHILMQHFAWKALDAHRARVGIIELVYQTTQAQGSPSFLSLKENPEAVLSSRYQTMSLAESSVSIEPFKTLENENDKQQPLPKAKKTSWRSVLFHKHLLMLNHQYESEQPKSIKLMQNYSWVGWALGAREDVDIRDLVVPHSNDGANTSKQSDILSAADNTIPLISSSKTANSDNIRRELWNRVSIRREYTVKDKILTPDEKKIDLKRHVSLIDIFPDNSSQSASSVLNYILWLRSQRNISSNYEANILRGLIKLVKFRFASILSETTPSSYSSKSKNASPLDDLPLVIELRRLHRDAGQKAKKSQRSSDEGKKWLEWDEYLEVIEMLRCDLLVLIDRFETNFTANEDRKDARHSHEIDKKKEHKIAIKKKEIATIFQHYLILSFFASVPDRQRTFRELELGRSFLRVDGTKPTSSTNHAAACAIWVIKHRDR